MHTLFLITRVGVVKSWSTLDLINLSTAGFGEEESAFPPEQSLITEGMNEAFSPVSEFKLEAHRGTWRKKACVPENSGRPNAQTND